MEENKKKSAAIRVDLENYNFIKDSGFVSNRSISGQTNWMCRVIYTLQVRYNDIYQKITDELTHNK